MSDRDVPSVPVTTLAGLTSLSDLLSELPVSETLSNVTSLNKSLLFHALVANESKNLLSIRDETLVRQLVHAIEQTNSDEIELKTEYAIQQHSTNISTYPELLQGIYNYRPTVFNCSQKITNKQNQQHNIQQSIQQMPAQQNSISNSKEQEHFPKNSPSLVIAISGEKECEKLNYYEHSQFQHQEVIKAVVQHQPQKIILSDIGTFSELSTETANKFAQKITNIKNASEQEKPSQTEIISNLNTIEKTKIASHQKIIDLQHQSKYLQQNSKSQQFTEQTSVVEDNLKFEKQHMSVNQHSQCRQLPTYLTGTSIVYKEELDITSQYTKNINLGPQQDKISQNEQKQQIIQGNFQNVLNLQRQQMQNIASQHQKLNVEQRNDFIQKQQLVKTKSNQSVTNAIFASELNSQHIASTSTSNHTVMDSQNLHNMCATSIIPTTKIGLTELMPSTSLGAKSQVRVCITRLKTEDARLMQQSIKEFVQKSPELAKKIGIFVAVNTAANSASLPTSRFIEKETQITNTKLKATTSTDFADTFSIMKADEKRIISKRKIAISIEDIPADQIFSQPKVRRVERVLPSVKCSKEEIMRSQTYQQFMRNMEEIIELLDDTETPNFESDDIDENVECIPSKMLNTMSNDVAKLKAKQVLDSIPKNKLTLLINYAMRNVYLAKNYSAGPDDDDEIIDDEIMEKILNAIEACLLICNIYSTAKDLKFLQEDNISLIIKFVQFQFRETIFPSYDPVYTVKSIKKNDNRKKSKFHQSHNRSLQLLYSKAVELMKVFVTLFDKCIFVDTIVLPLSTLAIEPFFVDNIETLQFVCLELVTTIFRKERYDKIRSCILGDILSSIDRLPSSKKNLRPFKLTNNGENIQMVTALVLQLIQCATILPDTICENVKNIAKGSSQFHDLEDDSPGGAARFGKPNNDIIVLKKYDVAISIGGNFLTTFLNKCKNRTNEIDFRPLFENFIHDLLATVNKPEWPASELLLSLLGTMLVRYVSDKSIEQSIRLVSLDYLGIVAARLRKDTVESRCKVNIIDSMIKSIKAEQEKEGDLLNINNKIVLDPEEERTEFLQKILLDFLAVNAQEENLIWDYARHFYLAQWYRDIIYQRRRIAEGKKSYASRKKSTARKKRRKESSSGSSDCEYSDESMDDVNSSKNGNRGSNIIDQELNLEIFNILEERKQYLLGKIRPYASGNDMIHTSQHIKTYIDYNNAQLIAQYLATKRPFSQSFDGYLKKIILVVNEPSIAVRTRAMKCLANIVEVDPMVLKRKDMQMGVNQKFLDAAISVREAAVDLVGKFVLSNEELIDQYYDMLSTRILDTGVSVRKRVIKILRDICIEYPDFEKIPEICVKMIRRVNDEEGIQKLVTEVFMKMWFVPCNKNDKHGIQRKINQIIDVVNTAHDTGTTWLEGLLNSIFQPKENMMKIDGNTQEPVRKNTEPPQEIVLACQQLADGLVNRLIELEDTDNERMLGCITTLHLLAKVRPQLLVRHAITIEPYLNIKCHPSTAPKFICAVADILEKVVPLVNYASESFLASLEEHLMLLVVSLNQAVVTSCVSCLGALVNKITKNYKLIRDCFQKFYRILEFSRTQVVQNNYSIDSVYTPMFRRSLFTIGILMRYFDFKSVQVIGETNILPATICDDVFNCLMFFTQCANNEIRKQALIALGSFCVMNDEYLTKSQLKSFYCDVLLSDTYESSVKIICMRNIWIYLTESEMYMYNKEKEWEKQAKNDDLKEMNDVSSGMASRIIQLYLQEILDCFLNADENVRLWAVKVVQIVLRQGLVHPVRMVPYLICLSTDSKLESAHRADALIKDIDKTYAGFVNMKVQFGLQLCFKLQEILQCNNKSNNESVIRGYVKRESDAMPSALNDFLYSLLRTTKPQRRALVQTVTKQFDDQKTSLRQMLYIADNLAYFPYVVQDEPLYLIHQIDLLISMAGTNLLATFKECLKPSEQAVDILADDDDEEDPEALLQRLPENTTEIQRCITSAQACMLLLILKDHLKDMYSLTDGKISRYSPSEQKMYEKAVTRKVVPDFNPKSTIDIIQNQKEKNVSFNEDNTKNLNSGEKIDLVLKYLDFKKLMLKLDPDDVESGEESRDKSKLNDSLTLDIAPTTSLLNLTETNQKFDVTNENLLLPNFKSEINQFIPTTVQDVSVINSTLRASKSAFISKPVPTRKQSLRNKRKKHKLLSSEEEDEEDDNCSDEDYA